MWTIISRIVLPVMLLIVGLASLIYGAKFHSVPILAEEKTQVTVDLPGPLMRGPRPFPGTQLINEPPQLRRQVVERMVQVVLNVSEASLVRDVTVGGAALDESNEIKRTYTGQAPSLCPT